MALVCRIFRLIFITFILNVFWSPIADAASTSSNTKDTHVRWNSKTHVFDIGPVKLKIAYDMVCGYYNNQAEYASFGLETQRFKCSKIVIPISLTYKNLFGTIEFAPLYDPIKAVTPGDVLIYGQDAQGRNIQGNNPYFDWYKNLGTRIYYLGEFPLLQAYAGYKFSANNQIIAGRIKNETGLLDKDTPWQDDGMFSPYAYWLSRDLLSGIAYQFTSRRINIRTAVLSGNNPMKGYSDYLDYVQSPNLKANNTPSFALDLTLNFGSWLNPLNKSKLIVGATSNTMNSTWSDALNDGKRRNSVYAVALLLDWPISQAFSVDVFSQYTRYLSGLQTNSSQFNASNPLFKNITQNGYFTGLTVRYKVLSLSYTHEVFDRFDFNVFKHWVDSTNRQRDFSGLTLGQIENLKQSSDIINFKYQFTRYTALLLNYQHINNPLEWVSSIINTKPDYRLAAALEVSF